MVTVGILAAILNVFVLFVVAVADRAIELIVRGFAISRLKCTRRAPVIHDSDTWLPNIPRSFYKYHRNPAISFTLLCAVFLVTSELVSEVGVESSNFCSPRPRKGPVISLGDTSENITGMELSASAFFLQSIKFFGGNLSFVPSGFPRNVSSAVCVSCLNLPKYKPILANCTIRSGIKYPPGALTIGIIPARGMFAVGDVVVGFNHTFTNGSTNILPSFMGVGDLTRNAHHCAAFLIHGRHEDNAGVVLTYFEYAYQRHCNTLVEEARRARVRRQNGDITAFWTVTEGNATSHVIKCQNNEIAMPSFREAVRVYRAMQMENTLYPIWFDKRTQSFQPLKVDDIYRAVLSMKLIDDGREEGDYFEYTECGIYNVQYMVPLFIAIFLICTLVIVSMVLATRGNKIDVPYSSSSWFKELSRVRGEESGTREPRNSTRQRFFGIQQEMVLVGDFGDSEMHIEWQSDGRSIRGHRITPEEGNNVQVVEETPDSPSSVSTPGSSPLSEDMCKK